MKSNIMYGVIAALIVIIILCFSQKAQADTISASYINTTYDYTFPANVFLDDNSNGFGVSYGLELNPNVSLDFGYSNLGQAEQTVLFIPTKFESRMFTVAVRGYTQIGTVAGHTVKAHGIIGAARAKAGVTVGGTSLSDSDMGLLLGVGLSLNLSPHQALTVMYKKADLTFSNTVTFDYDPKMLEIGYSYHF